MNDPRNSVDTEVDSVDWEEPDAEETGTFRAAIARNALGYQRPGQELEPSGVYGAIREQDFAAIEMRVAASLARSGDVGPSERGVPEKPSLGEMYGCGTQTGRISGRRLNNCNFEEK